MLQQQQQQNTTTNKPWKNNNTTQNIYLQRAAPKKFSRTTSRTSSRGLSLRMSLPILSYSRHLPSPLPFLIFGTGSFPASEQQDITQALRTLRDLPALRTLDLDVVVDNIRYSICIYFPSASSSIAFFSLFFGFLCFSSFLFIYIFA